MTLPAGRLNTTGAFSIEIVSGLFAAFSLVLDI